MGKMPHTGKIPEKMPSQTKSEVKSETESDAEPQSTGEAWDSLEGAAFESAKSFCDDVKTIEHQFTHRLAEIAASRAEEDERMAGNANREGASETEPTAPRAEEGAQETIQPQKIAAAEAELLKKRGAKPISRKELEKWEDAISDDLGFAMNSLRQAGINPDADLDTTAEVLQHMVFANSENQLNNSVEAQAGQLHRERAKELRAAIEASGGEDSEHDIQYVEGFIGCVMKHLRFKYMSKLKYEEDYKDNPALYELARTKSHNDVIKYLNGLNNLAEQYGTRRFTPRNFWPSSLRSTAEQTGPMAAVMRYDRDVVEEYYYNAFPNAEQEQEAAKQKKDAYGRR